MELRPATKDDFDVLFELFNELQITHYKTVPDFFKPASKDKVFYDYFDDVIENVDKHLVLAFDGNVPIGYVYYVISNLPDNVYRTGRQIIYINQIAISKNYRGKGYGKALIGHVKDVAKERKINQVGLDVWLFNEGAIKFFESQGFNAFNQIMWHKTET